MIICECKFLFKVQLRYFKIANSRVTPTYLFSWKKGRNPMEDKASTCESSRMEHFVVLMLENR